MNPKPANLESYLGRPSPIEPQLRFLLKGVRKPVIFDVGACEGEDTIRYSRMFPGARLLAFEPLPANQEILRENLARYSVAAEVIPCAVSNRKGTAEFHVSDGRPPELFSGENWNYGNKSSSLLPPALGTPMHGWITFPDRITVQCDTLVDVCASHDIDSIDFMHMDVQGAEGLVLEGASAVMPRIRVIWMEVPNQELYSGQKLRGEIESILRNHGFAVAYEELRGAEGDQLYVNLRFARNRLYLAGLRLTRVLSRLANPFRVKPTGR